MAVQNFEESKMLCSFIAFFNTKKVASRATFFLFLFVLPLCSYSQEKNSTTLPPQKVDTLEHILNDDKTGLSSKNKKQSITPITKEQTILTFSKKFNAEETQPQSIFDCDQKIVAVLLLKNYPVQLHDIVVKWMDPYGKERESTDIPTYTSKDSIYTWSSLSLHRDVTAGMLQWINPAAGMEEFIGEWQVKVMIGDKLIQSGKFTVVC